MLRVATRPDREGLWITGTVRPAGAATGIRVRQRAGTDNPALAREEAAALAARLLRQAWHGPRAASRNFAEAALSYLEHEARSADTRAAVRKLVLHFREAPLAAIDQDAVDQARKTILRPGAAPSTVVRNLITPLRAILAHAARRQWCPMPSFDLPKQPKGRTAFLLPGQAAALIEAAAPHVRPLLIFLACTGCRTGEALGLQWPEIDLRAARAILWEGETKSGRRRIVHLPPAAVAALAGLAHREGHVFRPRGLPCYTARAGRATGQLRTAWATACKAAGLPGELAAVRRPDRPSPARAFKPEHTPHVMRHSWATWHYATHRDLLLLQREGGWSSTSQVERYAHLMPAGHESAIFGLWGMVVPRLTPDPATSPRKRLKMHLKTG